MKEIILSETDTTKEIATIRNDGIVIVRNMVWKPGDGWYPESAFSMSVDDVLRIAKGCNDNTI